MRRAPGRDYSVHYRIKKNVNTDDITLGVIAADSHINEHVAQQAGEAVCCVYAGQSCTFKHAWNILQTDEYQTAVYEYNNFQRFGMPTHYGWKHQNVLWVIMVTAVDLGVRELERRMLDKNKV